MSHVGHLAHPAEKELHNLIADPQRQDNKCRDSRIIEIKPQGIKHLDLPGPIQHGISTHESRYGPGGPYQGCRAARICDSKQRHGTKASHTIEPDIHEASPRKFQHASHQPQKDHIAEQVHEPAVQKHVREGPFNAVPGRYEPVSHSQRPAQDGLIGIPFVTPFGIDLILRGDDLSCLELFHELPVALHVHERSVACFIGCLCGLTLRKVFHLTGIVRAALCITGDLDTGQTGVEIKLHGLFIQGTIA